MKKTIKTIKTKDLVITKGSKSETIIKIARENGYTLEDSLFMVGLFALVDTGITLKEYHQIIK